MNHLGCCSEGALKVGVEMFLALVIESLMCNQRVFGFIKTSGSITRLDSSNDNSSKSVFL